jgi:hypothetical protein
LKIHGPMRHSHRPVFLCVVLFGFNWRRAGWWRTFARADVARSPVGVVVGGGKVGLADGVLPIGFKQLLEKRPAPAATRTSAVTIGQLTLTLRALDAKVVDDLAFRNVKAQAEFVVEFHGMWLSPALLVLQPGQASRANVARVAAERGEFDPDDVAQRFEKSRADFITYSLQKRPADR